MDAPANVKCSCGRTVPPLSPHRPGAARAGLRAERKAEWCPDTDLRKKQAEEAAKEAPKAVEAVAEAVEPAPVAPSAGTQSEPQAP